MIKLEIKIEDQEVHQALRRLADQGKIKPALRDIGEYLVEATNVPRTRGDEPRPWAAIGFWRTCSPHPRG